MDADARFSPCRRYRYALWRRWADGPQVLFIMLNPASADESRDDPTIRRCLGFARAWGCGSLAVGNLFARRCGSAAGLAAAAGTPAEGLIGADNDPWLLRLHGESQLTIAAWGDRGRLLGRSRAVRTLIPELHCLGVTRRGEPRHPLYVPASANYRPLGAVQRARPGWLDPDAF
ncbi:MAG: DUF1643 domain-containing protein [Pseudomonadota bacterium]|jgi:hypothetical protein